MTETNTLSSVAEDHQSASHGIMTVHAKVGKPIEGKSMEEKRRVENLLTQARKHFRYSASSKGEKEWREKANKELKFLAGEHFSEADKAERGGLPCLVVDRIGPAIDQVINDARQSPLEAKFLPVGLGADKATAEVIQGISRNISNDSNGEVAILTAYEHAVQIGRGWFELKAVQDDLNPFKTILKIGRIGNPFAIYPDPDVSEFDYSDMMFSFKMIPFTRESFIEKWPNAIAASFSLSEVGEDDQVRDWFGDNKINVAEYWYVTMEDVQVHLMSTGEIVEDSMLPPDASPIDSTTVQKRKVHGTLITGTDVLEEWDWLDTEIPHIPVIGRDYIEEKIRKHRGMVRDAMDSNKRYDYMISKQTEAIGLAPKSQWKMAAGQDEGYEADWANSNRKPIAVLHYKILDYNGQPIPPPERIQPDVAIGAINQAVANAAEDVRATTSTYQPSLGQVSAESSGRAILARQREADNAHFNYHDNLGRAVLRLGKTELRLIPFYYDEAEMMMISDPDGGMREVQLNQPYKDQDGVDQYHKIGAGMIGRYHTTISSGPSYPARKQQAAADLMNLAQHMPGVMARGADIMVRMMDTPFGEELAKRLTPPDIAAAKDGPTREQLQQQLQQATGLINQLTQQLHASTDSVERERLRLASSERNTDTTAMANMIIAAMKQDQQAAQIQFQEEMKLLHKRIDLLANSPETANPSQAPAAPAGPQGSPAAAPPMAPEAPASAGALQ